MAPKMFKEKKIRCFEVVPDNIKPYCKQFTNDLKKQRKSMKLTDKADCKAVLFYQPIVSRAGTDIEGALQKISNEYEDKYVALVVLHHTFDPECIVPDSKRAVNIESDEKPEKRLVVDCLFHEDSGLLKCRKNNEANKEVAKWLYDVKHKQNKKQQKDKQKKDKKKQPDKQKKDKKKQPDKEQKKDKKKQPDEVIMSY